MSLISVGESFSKIDKWPGRRYLDWRKPFCEIFQIPNSSFALIFFYTSFCQPGLIKGSKDVIEELLSPCPAGSVMSVVLDRGRSLWSA